MEIKQLAEIRRDNTRRLVALYFENNKSELAREYQKVTGQENPTPNLFGDLLRENSKKTFGEKLARNIERAAKLKSGQLDIQGSQLELDERLIDRAGAELRTVLDDLTQSEIAAVLDRAKEIIGQRKKTKRA